MFKFYILDSISIIGGFFLNVIVNKFKKMGYKHIFLYTIIALCFAASVFFVNHNYSFYERPIAKVIKTNLEDTTEMNDMYQNKDLLFTQQYHCRIKKWRRKRTAYPFNE